ncbi:MAG: hypothetical protein M3R27_09415 [Bacteroidota bacterium]|nr:hypothetical protein [Bacteroidota bacterium]
MSKSSQLINVIHPPGIRTEVRVFDVAERWLKRRENLLVVGIMFLSLMFSLLLFDSRVSPGGDDSASIERAWQLAYDGKSPYFQESGYPIFLSLIIKLAGLNVIALKLFSVFCQLAFVWFSYKAFRKRVPYFVFISSVHFFLLLYSILFKPDIHRVVFSDGSVDFGLCRVPYHRLA